MNNPLLEHILQLSRQLAETRDIDQLLTMAMEETLQIVGADLCYLVLLEDGNELRFLARSSTQDHHRDQQADDLSRSIFDEVVQTREPLVVTDALSDELYATKSSIKNLQCRSVMCVPLMTRGEAFGALYVENRKIVGAFRQDDLELLILFANQAAVSIENAQIIANLEGIVAERTAELEQSWHEAIEANRMRTTLLGQLTHDMRNSSAVIRLSLDMLGNPRVGDMNPKQSQLTERSSLALEQLNALIENLFALSKSELQSLDIHPIDTNMNQFLHRMQEIGSGLPWRDDVTFRTEIAENLPTICIDPVRIQQVIMNLLSNAQKFTTQGEVRLYAQLNDANELHIGVRDTGSGIPTDQQEHIFERFKQFDTDSARQAKGAGFGLAICKELVEKHGGRISVESTPGVGSDFEFILSM